MESLQEKTDKPRFVGVIFDCVGICLTDGQKEALPTLEELTGIEAEKLGHALGGTTRFEYITGKLDPNQYWENALTSVTPLIVVRQRVAKRKNVSLEEVDIGYLASTFEEIILNKYTVVQEVVNLLEQLKKAGYWRGMISNTPKERGEYWTRNFPSLWPHFDKMNFSFSNSPPGGKPDDMKPLVDSLLSGTTVSPPQLVYVDDKLLNVEKAVSEQVGVGGGIHITGDGKAGQNTNPKIVSATIGTLGTVLKERYGFTF